MKAASKGKTTPWSRVFPASPTFRPPDKLNKTLIDHFGVIHLTHQGTYKNGKIDNAWTKCGVFLMYPMRPKKSKRNAATCLTCLAQS